MTIEVRLTWHEVAQAAHVGTQRRVSGLANGRRDRWGCSEQEKRWDRDIEGACAECAVAKALGMYWSGALGDLRADDVGVLQVRSTPLADGRLVLHESDPDDRAFILVTGRSPDYCLVGWLLAGDGKREEWWCDPQGNGRWAYFVPQGSLCPDVECLGRGHGGESHERRDMPGAVSVDRGASVRAGGLPSSVRGA